ncbi:MAG TPA: SDR family oxidoreductase [Candidatus Acidoferrum sp.]|nr:SDR family oxidoreductase [Candidatus Acidoferrum sp.]
MNRLNDKVAIITGGASGLGEATARLFAQEGATVIIGDIHSERGTRVADEINATGGTAYFRRTNVRVASDVEQIVAFAEKECGRLNIMVANAGIGGAASRVRLEDVTEEQWDEVMQVNPGGVWRSFKYAAPALRRAGGGAMTSTGSLAGVSIPGGALLGAYTTSKFAITGLTKYFASELAEDGIRVNCVAAGRIRTNIDESFGMPDEQLRKAKESRFATPDVVNGRRSIANPGEVAQVHLFLCSDEASFVTGQAIVADGGADLFPAMDWADRGLS